MTILLSDAPPNKNNQFLKINDYITLMIYYCSSNHLKLTLSLNINLLWV